MSFILSYSCYCQKSITIYDEDNCEPIAYAYAIINNKTIEYADIFGFITFNKVTQADSITIGCMGYEPINQRYSQINHLDTLRLRRKYIPLIEISVYANNKKPNKLKYINKKSNGTISATPAIQLISLFTNPKDKKQKILSFSLYFNKRKNLSKEDIIVRPLIFSSNNNNPDSLLIITNEYQTITKDFEGIVTFNVQHSNILMEDNLFIGFEYLPINKNAVLPFDVKSIQLKNYTTPLTRLKKISDAQWLNLDGPVLDIRIESYDIN